VKPAGKSPLGRCRYRWYHNIKKCVLKIKWKGIYCIHLAEDRV
jgi:hypothetical protein